MATYERVTLNRGGRNSRFDCNLSSSLLGLEQCVRLKKISKVKQN